jgi:hypothetical protein
MKFACLICGLGECTTTVVDGVCDFEGEGEEERRGEEMSLSCTLPLYCTVLYTINEQRCWDSGTRVVFTTCTHLQKGNVLHFYTYIVGIFPFASTVASSHIHTYIS